MNDQSTNPSEESKITVPNEATILNSMYLPPRCVLLKSGCVINVNEFIGLAKMDLGRWIIILRGCPVQIVAADEDVDWLRANLAEASTVAAQGSQELPKQDAPVLEIVKP